MIDIRRLRYVAAIAEHGSFSGAARSLRIAQPALSSQVRDLEAELGTKLFVRHSRGVKLTGAGEIVVRYAARIDDDLTSMVSEIQDAEENPRGHVRLGIPYSVSVVLTVPLLQYMERHFPEISLEIAQAFSGFIDDWLVSDKTDCAILLSNPQKTGLAIRPLVTESLYLIVCAGSKLANRRSISFENALATPLVLPTKAHGLRVLLEGLARSRDAALNVKTEIDAGHELIKLVEQDFGTAILAKCAVTDQLARGSVRAIPISRPQLKRTVNLGIGHGGQKNRAVKFVEQAIETVTCDLVSEGIWEAELHRQRNHASHIKKI
jgi:LysR family transcriptional regulator, nitrogen assimilation regulatory protein